MAHKYKRYIVFECCEGGHSGLLGIMADFDSMQDALEYLDIIKLDGSQIVDRDTWEIKHSMTIGDTNLNLTGHYPGHPAWARQ